MANANPSATIVRTVFRPCLFFNMAEQIRRYHTTPDQSLGMRTHIKVVGWSYIIYCALKLLAAAGMLFGGILGGVFSGSLATLLIAGAAGVAFGIVYGVIALFGLAAGFAFLSYRPWARYVLILVSVLNVFSPWLGTALGIYALWVLFNKETVELFRS